MVIELKETNEDLLVRLLKSALADNGKVKQLDKNNNVIYVDANIYSNEVLVNFLQLSLSNFNQVPKFTNFTFDNDKFVETFKEILVSGAILYALSSQALIERGREFSVSVENGGVNFIQPSLAEMLNTQHERSLYHHYDKLKMIKNDFKFDS
jgi:hypothetical protein